MNGRAKEVKGTSILIFEGVVDFQSVIFQNIPSIKPIKPFFFFFFTRVSQVLIKMKAP